MRMADWNRYLSAKSFYSILLLLLLFYTFYLLFILSYCVSSTVSHHSYHFSELILRGSCCVENTIFIYFLHSTRLSVKNTTMIRTFEWDTTDNRRVYRAIFYCFFFACPPTVFFAKLGSKQVHDLSFAMQGRRNKRA